MLLVHEKAQIEIYRGLQMHYFIKLSIISNIDEQVVTDAESTATNF